MKRRLVLFLSVLVLFICPSMGIASWCPDGSTQVPWEDMGQFDGEEWGWSDAFLIGELQGNWDPRPEDEPFKTIKATDSRMELRSFADGTQDTVVVVKEIAAVISYPVFCRQDGGGTWGWFLPPDGCITDLEDPDYNYHSCEPVPPGVPSCIYGDYVDCPDDEHEEPCCHLWKDLQFADDVGPPLESYDIESVQWDGQSPTSIIDNYSQVLNLSYVLGTGSNPVNWWEGPDNFSDDRHELRFFFDDTVPAANTDQSVEVVLTNGRGSGSLRFHVKETTAMPAIPAELTQETVYAPSGKKIRGLSGIQVPVQNINVREVDDHLSIQWPEPDAPFTPGIELRLFVGNRIQTGDRVDNYYGWVWVPSQSGTGIVPQEYWRMIQDKLIELEFSQAVIRIIYRKRYFDEAFGSWYMNSGQSEAVPFPLN